MHSTINYVSNFAAVKIAITSSHFPLLSCQNCCLKSQISEILQFQVKRWDSHWKNKLCAIDVVKQLSIWFISAHFMTFNFLTTVSHIVASLSYKLYNTDTRKWRSIFTFVRCEVPAILRGHLCQRLDVSGPAQFFIGSSVCQLSIIVQTWILTSSRVFFGLCGHDSLKDYVKEKI